METSAIMSISQHTDDGRFRSCCGKARSSRIGSVSGPLSGTQVFPMRALE
jgi:hypothetical protein